MSLILFFNPHTFRNKRFHTFFNITFRVITIVAITALSFVLFECKPCNTIFYLFTIGVVTFISDICDLSPFFVIMNKLMFPEVAKSANDKQDDQLKHCGSSNLEDNKTNDNWLGDIYPCDIYPWRHIPIMGDIYPSWVNVSWVPGQHLPIGDIYP